MKELRGICKKAIKEGLCLGCNKLELEEFEGQEHCKYIRESYEEKGKKK